MSLINENLFDKDAGSDFTSSAYQTEYTSSYSVVASFTETSATLSGTVKLQASNDAFIDANGENRLTENTGATWVDVSGGSESVSGDTDVLFNVSDANYTAFRVVWTNSGGDGTFKLFIRAKDRSR